LTHSRASYTLRLLPPTRHRKRLNLTISAESRTRLTELSTLSGVADSRVVEAGVQALYEMEREEALARIEAVATDVRPTKKAP
jgi:hypothetical protein